MRRELVFKISCAQEVGMGLVKKTRLLCASIVVSEILFFRFFPQELLIKRYSGNIRLCAMPHAGVSQMREFIQWRCCAQARYRLQRQCFTPRQPGNNGASSNWVHITVPGIIQPRSCFLNMLPPVFVSTCDVFYLFFLYIIRVSDGHIDSLSKIKLELWFYNISGKVTEWKYDLVSIIAHPTFLHSTLQLLLHLRRGEQDPLVASPGGDLGSWSQWLVSAVITISDSVEPRPCRGEHQHQHLRPLLRPPWPSCWQLCLCQVWALFLKFSFKPF